MRRFIRRIRRICRRTPAEWRLLARAIAVLVVVRLAMTRVPFRILYDRVERRPRRQRPTVSMVTCEQVARAVTAASRIVPGTNTCLALALVTRVLLTDCGIGCELRIGVAQGQGAIEAHAWVEHDGRVLVGSLDDLDRFRVLPTIGAR